MVQALFEAGLVPIDGHDGQHELHHPNCEQDALEDVVDDDIVAKTKPTIGDEPDSKNGDDGVSEQIFVFF